MIYRYLITNNYYRYSLVFNSNLKSLYTPGMSHDENNNKQTSQITGGEKAFSKIDIPNFPRDFINYFFNLCIINFLCEDFYHKKYY